jgi:hypothetical protein
VHAARRPAKVADGSWFLAHSTEPILAPQQRALLRPCAVLCCAVLCCAVLCCAVLCCAVLCCAVLYCMRACRTHLSPNNGPFPFPKDMFLKFVHENNGYFPVKIQALPEGTCVHVHTPVYQVNAPPAAAACLPVCCAADTQCCHAWHALKRV